MQLEFLDDVASELKSCTNECLRTVLGYTKYVGHHFLLYH